MRFTRSLAATVLLLSAVVLPHADSARAVELLINGNLESSVSPPGFTLTQTISEIPGSTVSAVEQISFANNPAATPGELGLFIKPASGNQGTYATQNQKLDITLTQTVTATAGRTYQLKGDAQLADGYSGSVEFLDALSPSDPLGTGTILSPTETFFELAFLNAANAVIGTPTSLDLRVGLTPNAFQTYMTTEITAPVGATQARLTAAMVDAVENFGFQDVYFDNFSLLERRLPALPQVERLTNGRLNNVGPPNGYEITELPVGEDTLSFIGFANHTPGGEQGMWLRAFAGSVADPADGIISQTVAGVAGGNYTFSGWSFWEPGYSGDVDTFPGTATDTFMVLEFLDGGGLPIAASTKTLDLDLGPDGLPDAGANPDDGQANDSTWRQFTLSGLAPTGTANVRITASGIDMINSATDPQSAFFDDFSLDGPAAGPDSDFDDDGDVDGNDFLIIQRGLGTTTTGADITAWKANFGMGAAVGAVGAVPEPATAVGAAMVALLGLRLGRRRSAATYG